ncbi:MAG: ABC transporter substrate-binding protein [Methanoregula sp.]
MKIFKQPLTSILVMLVLIMAACAGCASTPGNDSTGTTEPVTPAYIADTGQPVPSAPGSACTPVTITQTNGIPVTLPCMPHRIIVTNSDAAEMLIALGAADTVVGITETTKNISYVMDKIPTAQSIGDWQTPNIEWMLSLKPDAVISYASSKPKNLDQILAANITVIYLDCYRLPKLAQDARAVGALTGHEQKAETYAQMIENTMALVKGDVAAIPQDNLPRVYFEGYSDFTAAGTGSGSDELLTMAGGKNIVASLSTSSSPKVSAEWVVSQNPAYIMKVISAKETRPYPEIVETLKKRTGWNTISAIKQDRIYLFGSGIEYGPKAYIGLAATAKVLHPDLFVDLDPEKMLDAYAGEYVAGTNMTAMM